MLVNYSSNSLCDERMYQPYMESQSSTLVIVCMMNTHPEAFVSYHPTFKCKLLKMHDACTINPYFYIDFCERDTRTIFTTSVGLTQAWLNNGSCMFSILIMTKGKGTQLSNTQHQITIVFDSTKLLSHILYEFL